MFALMTLLALWLGVETHRARRQQRAIAAIEAAGGSGVYSERCAWGRKWLAPFIGEDYFRRVRWVCFVGPNSDDLAGWSDRRASLWIPEARNHLLFDGGLRISDFREDVLRYLDSIDIEALDLERVPVTDEGLRHLRALKGLKALSLGDLEITDEALVYLRGLEALEELDLYGNLITDRAMEHLSGLTNLKSIDLGNTAVSDEGIMRLAALPRLETLGLESTLVTSAGARRFQEAAPRVEIVKRDEYADGPTVRSPSATCWILSQADDQDLRRMEQTNEAGRKDRRRAGEVRYLGEIERLFVMGPGVTDGGLGYLESLTRLRRLVLLNTQVTDEGIKKLQQALPNCQIER
jgi:hypothetical protein